MKREFTPEHRANMSAAKMGHSVAPEVRARISDKIRALWTPAKRAEHSRRNLGNRYVLDATVKGECYYCWAPATTYDHVIPRSRGGSDDPANIVPCCFTCNRSKRNKTPEEWIS